ncbi:hypothetical protein V1520DRAFT_354811 [Lipomyces starkeyi]
MRQAELLQSVSALQVSRDALRSCGLPIARRPVESGMSTQPGRRYYFGRSWISHRLLDPDREQYRCFWRRSKARKETMQTVEFILQSDGTSNFVEGKVLSELSNQLLQKNRYRKPYISRNIVAFDLGMVDYAAEYAISRSLLKDRKQDTKRKATRERRGTAFDETQFPVITTTTTVSRQYDRESGQVPASTVKQYFAELLEPDKWSGRGNVIAEKIFKDLLDIDRSFTITNDTAAAVKSAMPIVKTGIVPCSMIPPPLSEECRQNTGLVNKGAPTKDIISPSPREPGQFPVTVAITNSDFPVDDVTLAGGPLYLAKLRDAKKAEELVAQQEEASHDAPEKHANAEQQSESVALLRADEAISVNSIAATEKSNQSSETLDEPSADKNIVKSEVAASAQSKTGINRSDSAALNSAIVGQVHDMENAVEQGEERAGQAGAETPREKHTYKATGLVIGTDAEQPTCHTEHHGTTDSERINTVSVQEAIMSEDNTTDAAGYPEIDDVLADTGKMKEFMNRSEVEAIQTDIINRSEIETVREKEPINPPVELEQHQSEQKQIRSDIEWLKNGVFPNSDTEWVNRSSSTSGVAAKRRRDAFESSPVTLDEQFDMSESTERQVHEPTEDNPEPLGVLKKTLESVVSRQTEFQAKLDFAVSSQTDLEKELHMLRFYRDSETQSLKKAIAHLQHQVAEAKKVNNYPDDYGSEIQYWNTTVGQLQNQLAQPMKQNGVPEEGKKPEFMNIENEERGAATLSEGEDSGRPRKRENVADFPPKEKATEQSADMLVITPTHTEVRMKIVPELVKKLFPQAPEFASNAFGQLSRSETRRVTALANHGWVLVSVAQDGSLVFQKGPERKLTGVRLAVKVLAGVIVVSSVILTMLVGYGYTTMI